MRMKIEVTVPVGAFEIHDLEHSLEIDLARADSVLPSGRIGEPGAILVTVCLSLLTQKAFAVFADWLAKKRSSAEFETTVEIHSSTGEVYRIVQRGKTSIEDPLPKEARSAIEPDAENALKMLGIIKSAKLD